MIAIKDMEMPKNCGECEMRIGVTFPICVIKGLELGKRQPNDAWGNKPDWCPLVESNTIESLIDKSLLPDDLQELGNRFIKELRELLSIIGGENGNF